MTIESQRIGCIAAALVAEHQATGDNRDLRKLLLIAGFYRGNSVDIVHRYLQDELGLVVVDTVDGRFLGVSGGPPEPATASTVLESIGRGGPPVIDEDSQGDANPQAALIRRRSLS